MKSIQQQGSVYINVLENSQKIHCTHRVGYFKIRLFPENMIIQQIGYLEHKSLTLFEIYERWKWNYCKQTYIEMAVRLKVK